MASEPFRDVSLGRQRECVRSATPPVLGGHLATSIHVDGPLDLATFPTLCLDPQRHGRTGVISL